MRERCYGLCLLLLDTRHECLQAWPPADLQYIGESLSSLKNLHTDTAPHQDSPLSLFPTNPCIYQASATPRSLIFIRPISGYHSVHLSELLVKLRGRCAKEDWLMPFGRVLLNFVDLPSSLRFKVSGVESRRWAQHHIREWRSCRKRGYK